MLDTVSEERYKLTTIQAYSRQQMEVNHLMNAVLKKNSHLSFHIDFLYVTISIQNFRLDR